jgi:hypothetical protein
LFHDTSNCWDEIVLVTEEWVWNIGGTMTGRILIIQRKTCPKATLSSTNPTSTDQTLKLRLFINWSATNRLSHDRVHPDKVTQYPLPWRLSPPPTLRYSALEKIFSFPPLQDFKMSNQKEISTIMKGSNFKHSLIYHQQAYYLHNDFSSIQ